MCSTCTAASHPALKDRPCRRACSAALPAPMPVCFAAFSCASLLYPPPPFPYLPRGLRFFYHRCCTAACNKPSPSLLPAASHGLKPRRNLFCSAASCQPSTTLLFFSRLMHLHLTVPNGRATSRWLSRTPAATASPPCPPPPPLLLPWFSLSLASRLQAACPIACRLMAHQCLLRAARACGPFNWRGTTCKHTCSTFDSRTPSSLLEHALRCYHVGCLRAQVERLSIFLPMGKHGSARARLCASG